MELMTIDVIIILSTFAVLFVIYGAMFGVYMYRKRKYNKEDSDMACKKSSCKGKGKDGKKK